MTRYTYTHGTLSVFKIDVDVGSKAPVVTQ